MSEPCRVYWGSHGCELERGHDGHCRCVCAYDDPPGDPSNVGNYPYYGEGTVLWGEDAEAVWGPHGSVDNANNRLAPAVVLHLE